MNTSNYKCVVQYCQTVHSRKTIPTYYLANENANSHNINFTCTSVLLNMKVQLHLQHLVFSMNKNMT